MNNDKRIKIFVASAGELPDERESFYKMISQLNKAHKHLFLEVVEWEIDMVQGSYFDQENIQAAINPKLVECDFAVFLFYSRIGKYTREEYELAKKEKKQTFVYFKKGFSPDDEQIEGYKELLQFKKSLGDIILKQQYADMDEFEKILYPNLNLYLVETYPVLDVEKVKEENKSLSASVASLVQVLAEKDKKIKELEEGENDKAELQQLITERDALQKELLQNKEIQEQQAKDRAALELQLSVYKEPDGLKAKALVEVEKGNYAEAEAYLKESAKGKIEETAATFYELGKIKKLQLQYKEAFDYYELAVKVKGDNTLYLNDAGLMATQLGYPDLSIDYLQRILAVSEKNGDSNGIDLAACYNNLGESYRSRGENVKAIECYEMAVKTDAAKFGEKYGKIGTYYNNLGLIYDGTGWYDTAIDYYKAAIEIYQETYGDESENTSKTYHNLGLAYFRKGMLDEAIEKYEKAMGIYAKLFPNGHPDNAIYNNSIGLAYYTKGKPDDAIGYYEKALAISKKYYGEIHPDMATWYNNLGLAYDGKKDFITAIDYYNKALAIDRKYYGERHPNTALRYHNMGGSYNNLDEPDTAIDYLETALSIYNEFYGEQHPNIALLYDNLGLSFYKKKDYKQAVDYFQKALTMIKTFLAPDHPTVLTIADNLLLGKEALGFAE